jgi:hypothetical protein
MIDDGPTPVSVEEFDRLLDWARSRKASTLPCLVTPADEWWGQMVAAKRGSRR